MVSRSKTLTIFRHKMGLFVFVMLLIITLENRHFSTKTTQLDCYFVAVKIKFPSLGEYGVGVLNKRLKP